MSLPRKLFSAIALIALSEVPVSNGARAMYASVTQPLTFQEFLVWDDDFCNESLIIQYGSLKGKTLVLRTAEAQRKV
ncbi:MAG: hypothetical protein RM338_15020 [Nostoc sp. DedQUE12a]|nr:hypothetical protein [Nostoc sp. DedQUE12a]